MQARAAAEQRTEAHVSWTTSGQWAAVRAVAHSSNEREINHQMMCECRPRTTHGAPEHDHTHARTHTDNENWHHFSLPFSRTYIGLRRHHNLPQGGGDSQEPFAIATLRAQLMYMYHVHEQHILNRGFRPVFVPYNFCNELVTLLMRLFKL